MSPELAATRPTVCESWSQTVHLTACSVVETAGVVHSDPGSAHRWPPTDQPGLATWSRQDRPHRRPEGGGRAQTRSGATPVGVAPGSGGNPQAPRSLHPPVMTARAMLRRPRENTAVSPSAASGRHAKVGCRRAHPLDRAPWEECDPSAANTVATCRTGWATWTWCEETARECRTQRTSRRVRQWGS